MPREKTDDKPVRVLLFAGAATREYQFVRNLLAPTPERAASAWPSTCRRRPAATSRAKASSRTRRC